jgi:hypothetical protein
MHNRTARRDHQDAGGIAGLDGIEGGIHRFLTGHIQPGHVMPPTLQSFQNLARAFEVEIGDNDAIPL